MEIEYIHKKKKIRQKHKKEIAVDFITMKEERKQGELGGDSGG